MSPLYSSTRYLLFILLALPVYSRVLPHSGRHQGALNKNAHTEDDFDPSFYLSMVHSPTTKGCMIHHLSKNLLAVTKELLDFSPRSRLLNVTLHERMQQLQNLPPQEVSDLLFHQGILVPPPRQIVCGPSTRFYRNLDGSCNNLNNPCWGKTDEPYQRWLPAIYSDGVNLPRLRANGQPLPSPRQVFQWVSSQMRQTANTTYPSVSNLVVAWGQMVAHEMILTPSVTNIFLEGNGTRVVEEALRCCGNQSGHSECNAIRLDFDDGFYPRGHCLSMARSAAYVFSPFSCSPAQFRPREQMNQLTSYIDASLVYGSSEEHMRQLREQGGFGAKLTMDFSTGWTYPPRQLNTECKVAHQDCDSQCFHTGERRANENPVLGSLHTVWAREHNRLVDRLRSRGWPEETLFYVVRKIVGALMQHITYREYLPVLLGTDLPDWMELRVPSSNYRYDPTINPTIYNVFATAAFRFGHSMISGHHMRKGTSYSGSPLLSEDFFSMEEFCRPRNDPVVVLLSGQAAQRAQRVDNLFSRQVTNHLFAKEINGFGLDLFSVNVQRGRDHGLPPYNRWREACGLPRARDYSDMIGTLPDFVIDRLSIVYGPGGVDEVDLFVAGVSEFPVNGGILGPTFTCIISNQFKALKFGDRFWYENQQHAGRFTPAQIFSVQQTTLASLICRNSKLEDIQQMALLTESMDNPKVPCEFIVSHTDLDLNLWP